MPRPDLSDTLVILGLLLIAAGAGWIYPPAGLIVPGAALLWAGVWMARDPSRKG